MQAILNRVTLYGAKMGSETNRNETKAFPIPGAHQLPNKREQVNYVIIPNNKNRCFCKTGQQRRELPRRSTMGTAFLQGRRVRWAGREVNLGTKIRVFRAAIRPVLIYECEIRPLLVEDTKGAGACSEACTCQSRL